MTPSLLNKKSLVLSTALIAAAAFSGCSLSSPGASGNHVISLAQVHADKTKTPAQKAEDLALAAEQLMTPSTFMYANEIANDALTIDPTNARARLWAAVSAPAMEFQGIAKRVAPLARTSVTRAKAYQDFVTEVKSYNPDQSVTTFLFDGPEDIQSESDVQEVIGLYTARLDDMRRTLRDLKSTDLTIHLNQESAKQQALQDAQSRCSAVETSEGVYEVRNCDLSKAYEIKMNRADFEALQNMTAGYQVYFTMMNSYDLSGSIAVADAHASDVTPVSGDQIANELLANKKFGTIRDAKSYGVIPEIVQDAIIGAKYAAEMQSQLCPNGPDAINRPGYLFSQGLCMQVDDSLNRVLKIAQNVVNGPTQIVDYVGNKQVTTTVDLPAYSKAPVSDLRSLLPVSKNACGDVTSIHDGSVGGLFPGGGLNQVLAQDGPCNQ